MKHEVTIDPSKCELGMRRNTYLGNISCITPVPIRALLFGTAQNHVQIGNYDRFADLVKFYLRSITKYAEITVPSMTLHGVKLRV